MDEVNIICWLWGGKYSVADVARLANAVKRNLRARHRIHLFSDIAYSVPGVETHPIADRHLTNRSCFCRLRMFDPVWQLNNGLTGTIWSMDLDLVITGELDGYLQTDSSFKILQHVNATN